VNRTVKIAVDVHTFKCLKLLWLDRRCYFKRDAPSLLSVPGAKYIGLSRHSVPRLRHPACSPLSWRSPWIIRLLCESTPAPPKKIQIYLRLL